MRLREEERTGESYDDGARPSGDVKVFFSSSLANNHVVGLGNVDERRFWKEGDEMDTTRL